MRPAVIASVARNRKGQGAKRIRLMSPQFSGRRFIVMIFVGTLIFAPGVAMTILGINNDEDIDNLSPAHGVLYKVIGPAACGIGICVLIAAVMYYFCYGLANTTRPRHQSTTSSGSHHNRQSSHSSSHSHSHSHPQQDALIENEKQHRHKQHRRHHSKQKKVTQEETNEC